MAESQRVVLYKEMLALGYSDHEARDIAWQDFPIDHPYLED